MADPAPSRPGASTPRKSLLERLALLFREPEDSARLLEQLYAARHRDLLDDDALAMIEGVLAVRALAVRDLMVPRAHMEVVDSADPPAAMIARAVATGHSRFPVIDGDRDHVLGILLARDLLRLVQRPDLALRSLLRPPLFVPESMAAGALLRELRSRRTHLAIVVNEFGGTAGLITLEDVIEPIIGDIEDEHDAQDAPDADTRITAESDGRWRVRARMPVAHLNASLGLALPEDAADTLGGLVTAHLGRVPRRGDVVEMADVRLDVLHADARRPLLLRVKRTHVPAAASFAAAPET